MLLLYFRHEETAVIYCDDEQYMSIDELGQTLRTLSNVVQGNKLFFKAGLSLFQLLHFLCILSTAENEKERPFPSPLLNTSSPNLLVTSPGIVAIH